MATWLDKYINPTSTQIPEAYINLGHTYVALQQPINAIRMYELALSKCSRDRCPAVLFFLARCVVPAYCLYSVFRSC